jgi:hypothetical protein
MDGSEGSCMISTKSNHFRHLSHGHIVIKSSEENVEDTVETTNDLKASERLDIGLALEIIEEQDQALKKGVKEGDNALVEGDKEEAVEIVVTGIRMARRLLKEARVRKDKNNGKVMIFIKVISLSL